MRHLATVVLVAGCLGCDPAAPGMPDDASPPGDGATLGSDASRADAAMDPLPFPDAGVVQDGGAADGGGECAECMPAGECVTADCVGGACVQTPMADGTACGEMSARICVAGACVVRGCGDGYREPGSSSMREGCDDGNLNPGDACSPMCIPTAFTVERDSMGDWDVFPTTQGPAIGVDGTGALLFAWLEQMGDRDRVRARRYTSAGVPIPLAGADPITLEDRVLRDAVPTVAGLRGGGWVVVWAGEEPSGSFIHYRRVLPDGSVDRRRAAESDTYTSSIDPQVAPLGDGFIIVWTVTGAALPEQGFGVRARIFDRMGTPLGADITVPTELADVQDGPAVASQGDEWMVVWHDYRLIFGSPTRLVARRFRGAVPVDTAQFEVTPGEGGQPSIVAVGGGAYAVAFVDGGDVFARVVGASETTAPPGAVVNLTMSPGREDQPSIAALAMGAYLVAYRVDAALDTMAFTASSGAMLASEAPLLATILTMAEGHPSIATGTDGVWFAWSEVPDAEIFRAYHLPSD